MDTFNPRREKFEEWMESSQDYPPGSMKNLRGIEYGALRTMWLAWQAGLHLGMRIGNTKPKDKS